MSDQVLEKATGPERVGQDGQGRPTLRDGRWDAESREAGREGWWVLWWEKRGPWRVGTAQHTSAYITSLILIATLWYRYDFYFQIRRWMFWETEKFSQVHPRGKQQGCLNRDKSKFQEQMEVTPVSRRPGWAYSGPRAALDDSHSSTAHSVWSPDPHANPWVPTQTSLGMKSLGFSTTFQLVLSTLKSEWLYSQFSSVPQSCPTVCNPMDFSRPVFLSITNSWSLPKLMSIELVMPSNHLIFCHSLLLLPSIFPSIRVFSNESVLCIRWPNYCSFGFSISLSTEYSGLISFRIDRLDLLAVQGTLKSLLQHHSSKASILQHSALFIVQLSHPYMIIGKTIALAIQTFHGKLMSLLSNTLPRFVIPFFQGASVF